MSETKEPAPKYEPGGNRIMIVIAIIVVTALGGMVFSLLSRQHAPADAPGVKSRFLPPSERHDAEKPAAPAPATAPQK